MAMNELHVVFGATGGAGSAIVRELAAQGKRVRAVNRSGQGAFPAGVEVAKGDAMDVASARAAAQGATMVYHAVNVPYPQWTTALVPMAHSMIDVSAAAGVKLVVVDNLYMYDSTQGPMSDASPVAPVSRKGQIRAEVAELFLRAHRNGTLPVAIGRASDFYGPNVRNALVNDAFFRAALAGKTVRWAGKLDVPHASMFIDDFARGIVAMGQREEAFGDAWILPHAPAITGREFIKLTFEQTGKPVKQGTLSRSMVRLGGLFSPMIREFSEMVYQFEQPFVVDSSRFERTFGITATRYHDGIAQTIDWMRRAEQSQPALAH